MAALLIIAKNWKQPKSVIDIGVNKCGIFIK